MSPNPSELAALMAGMKPLIYCAAEKSDAIQAKKIADIFGFNFAFISTGVGALREFVIKKDSGRAQGLVAISRIEDDQKKWPRWGRALGYPDCCVAAKRAYDLQPDYAKRDLIALAYERGKSPDGSIPFHLNNVFNFSGVNFPEMNQMNSNLDILNVVPWQPCSYDCLKSLSAGARIWGSLERLFPVFSKRLREVLTRPVLYLEKNQFAVLKGTVGSADSCSYAGLLPVRSRLAPARLESLQSGDSISLKDDRVMVRRGEVLLNSFRCREPLLLNFV